MTKILKFALKIKGGWQGGWHMRSPPTLPPPKFGTCIKPSFDILLVVLVIPRQKYMIIF